MRLNGRLLEWRLIPSERLLLKVNIPKSVMNFHGYKITDFVFRVGDTFTPGNERFSQTFNIQFGELNEPKDHFEEIIECILVTEDRDFEIRVTIKGLFSIDQPLEEGSELLKMCQTNAPAILFPILRAAIASFTSQAGIRSVLLPLVNFQEAIGKSRPVI